MTRKYSRPRDEIIMSAAWAAAWDRALTVHRLRRMAERGTKAYTPEELAERLAEEERNLADFCALYGSITPERMLLHTMKVEE